MKAILTFSLFILSIQFGMAQEGQPAAKVAAQDSKVEIVEVPATVGENIQLARLYKNKNSRVKKALEFRTRKNSNKLA